MRILPLSVAWFLAAALPAVAQVSVEVVVEQEQFLRDEALPVKVRITNRSGQTLRLGLDNDWLGFAIESQDGALPSKLANPSILGAFTLESAQVATREVNLTPCFDLSQPGRYTVAATVRIKEWHEEVPSKPKGFEVVRGTRLWEQKFGVPASSGVPDARKYTLQQANYRKQMKLYLRLTDADEHHVFRVFPLGPLVSFSQPEAQVDKSSQLHVLFQTGARSFLFFLLNPDGEVILRQTYDYAATRPTLRSTEEGRIFVSGGLRRVTANDLPAPLPGDAMDARAKTNAPATASPPGQLRKNARTPKK